MATVTNRLFLFLIYLLLRCSPSCTLQLHLFVNYSLVPSSLSELINGTCEECLCKTMNSGNRTAVALNCYADRQECETFFNYSSLVAYSLQAASNVKFFARLLPSVHQPSDGTTRSPVSESTVPLTLSTAQQNIGKWIRR